MNSNIPEKTESYQDGMRVFWSESRIIADFTEPHRQRPQPSRRTPLHRRPHPPHHHRQPQNRRDRHRITPIITKPPPL